VTEKQTTAAKLFPSAASSSSTGANVECTEDGGYSRFRQRPVIARPDMAARELRTAVSVVPVDGVSTDWQ